MNLVESLGPHLPYLRRFSRALTGSQVDGDRYVRTALEALVAGDAEIESSLTPKTALFRMFLAIWNVTGAQLEDDVCEAATTESRIRKLTPLYRQAYLLKSLEGMAIDEIADVMNVKSDQAENMLSQAEADIEKELRTNVLIIEDEPIIAADIESLVEELGHTVDGIAATHDQAVKAVEHNKPSLILADVQLADGSSGIEAVEEIQKAFNVPVIFITAFPERLLTGDKPEPAYLISKPFKPDNVKAAISQALFFHTD